MNKRLWIAVGVLFSLTFGSNLMDSLSERGYASQANLFLRGLLWDQNRERDNIQDIFLRRDYHLFRLAVSQAYSHISAAPLAVRYNEAVACYQEQDIPALRDVLLTLSINELSAIEKNNVAIMKARIIYEEGVLRPLEDYFVQQGNAQGISTQTIQSIELFRDALYIKIMKPAVFPDRHPYLTYRVAFVQLSKAQFSEALLSFAKAGLPSEHPFVLYTKGLLALQASRFQEASDFFESAIGDPELDVDLRYRQIESAFGLEKYEDVLIQVKEFSEKYPSATAYSKGVSLLESLAYIHLGQVSRVLETLDNLAITYPFLNYYLGQEALLSGRDQSAVDHFQRAALVFNNDPQNQTRALYALAWAEFRSGQYVSAKDHFVQFLKRSDTDETKRLISLMKLGDASYNLHNYKDAAKEYNVVLSSFEIKQQPHASLYSRALINQARIFGKLRQTDSAVSLLDEYIERATVSSDKIEALKMKADLYVQDNSLEKANQSLLQMTNAYGLFDEDVLMALADNRFNLNQFESALQSYQRYLDSFPRGDRRMDARYGEVQSLLRLKRYKEALIQAGFTDAEFGTQLYIDVEKTIELIKQQEPLK